MMPSSGTIPLLVLVLILMVKGFEDVSEEIKTNPLYLQVPDELYVSSEGPSAKALYDKGPKGEALNNMGVYWR